jgi:ectoine hydroxylase-related dioxygenase (phytanoyl-CoA dioxygenase family)
MTSLQSDTPTIVQRLESDGFAIVPDAVPIDVVDHLIDEINRLAAIDDESLRRRRGSAFAIRNLIQIVPAIRSLTMHPAIRGLIQSVMSANALVTRAILFDKNPDANWAVPWHQDTTLAVAKRIDSPGFGPWSVKAGVPHVQPPAEILESMVTMRIHLDHCDGDNGALMVLPGSHRGGILEQDEIAAQRECAQTTICEVSRGGILLMKPLLLHSSAAAKQVANRRVVHLEYADRTLPNGLQWNLSEA